MYWAAGAPRVCAANINALAAADITVGCSQDPLSYCPNRPVSRAQMATFIARALALLESRSPTPDDTQEPVEFPGKGVDVIAGRANWNSGYFQGELYKQLLEELGYNVTDPAHLELGPSIAYIAMAQDDLDYWPNSWYPAHYTWHAPELPDGSLVGDHLTVVGEEMIADQPDGQCPIGWFAADIQVTANSDFLAANPAARALFEAVRLSVIDVSVANLAFVGGERPTDLATEWIADNRDLVDEWIAAARAAGPGES